MYAKDFRQKAWNALKGNWGAFALMTLVMGLIIGAASYTGIGTLILTGPLTLGMTMASLKVARGGKTDVVELFGGFKNFVSSLLLYIVNGILVFLWTLLLIVPGIIMGYAYSMSYFILADNPEISITDARKQSIEMMRGHKWRLFCLQFSFIGWWLLIIVTFGIASFWVGPYLQTATAAFYEDLKQRNAPAQEDIVEETFEIAEY